MGCERVRSRIRISAARRRSCLGLVRSQVDLRWWLVRFGIASAVGGAAPSFDVLVAARALQGAFAALLAPAALSLLSTTFTDDGERNRAFGVFGAVAGAGASVGLLLGGVLTEYLNWRWCLFVNLAIAGIVVAGALPLLTNLRPNNRPAIDVPGTLTATVG